MEVEDMFSEFMRHTNREYSSLSDLEWNEVRGFLEGLPGYTDRLDFLELLAALPDDGVVNGTVVDPALSNRNHNQVLTPIRNERARLLALHFDFKNIRHRASETTDHKEAQLYLHKVLHEYYKYHPNLMGGIAFQEQWAFL